MENPTDLIIHWAPGVPQDPEEFALYLAKRHEQLARERLIRQIKAGDRLYIYPSGVEPAMFEVEEDSLTGGLAQ